MHVIVLGVVGGATILGGVLAWRRLNRSHARSGEVMPSHYESLLHAEARHYPGLCPECRTANDPDYQFCRECGERLSDEPTTGAEREVRRIFEPRD